MYLDIFHKSKTSKTSYISERREYWTVNALEAFPVASSAPLLQPLSASAVVLVAFGTSGSARTTAAAGTANMVRNP
jgi:hypothetical protein